MSESGNTSTMTNGQATAAERVRRKRGIGFPVVDLNEAVSVLRRAGKHGSEHSISAFATYLGHSTPNSGSFKRRIAAFRDWKFIAGATGDRVVFTDLGRRVAYPADPVQVRRDIQEAFRNCELFMRVWDDSAKGVPLDLEALANLGVRELGVAPVSKERFARSLSLSAVVAGFAKQVGEKISFINPDNDATPGVAHEREIDDSIQVTDQVRAVAATAHASRSAEPLHLTAEPGSVVGRAHHEEVVSKRHGLSAGGDVVVERRQEPVGDRPALLHQQSWDFKVGNLVFEIKSSRSLPAGAFTQIGKVMAEVEKLKAILADDAETGMNGE
jgi:hypothetical protein